MFRPIRLVPVLAAILLAVPVLARAEIRIDINQGVVEPVPIAV